MTQKAPRYTTDSFHEDVAAAAGFGTFTPRAKYAVRLPCGACGSTGWIEYRGDERHPLPGRQCTACLGAGTVEGGM